MAFFEIECGKYHEKSVEAPTADVAIEIFWKGKRRDLGGYLLRFRERAWNGKFSWDDGKFKKRGSWRYVEISSQQI